MLQVANVSKSFEQPDGQELRVLENISFTLPTGGCLALSGPNGSGKTTLLRIVAGEIVPGSGEISLDGRRISRLKEIERAQVIGRVHQESHKAIASSLTVAHILAIAERRGASLSLRRPCPSKALSRIADHSENLSQFLEKRKDYASSVLSGGQRQLLAIAVALLGNPRVVLFDEHTASLDERFRSSVDMLLQNFLKSVPACAIVVTHDRAWAEAYCSHIAYLDNRRLEFRKGNAQC